MNAEEENEKEKRLNEPIFDLNAPQDEALDNERVQFSIYNDINLEKKDPKDEEWNLQMACTSEWFIRCSWINKFLFVDNLLQATNGCFVLENVLKSIESIFSKDVLESLSTTSTNFCYDRIPTDDNRALDEDELNKAMSVAMNWFLLLDSSTQVRIILKLLRLGGGGLIFMTYKSADKYYREKQDAAIFRSIGSSLLTDASQRTKDVNSKLKMSMHNLDSKSYGSNNYELSEFTKKKNKQLERRNTELGNYKKMKGLIEPENKKGGKKETNETVDYLQILPIWLNRRIMSYIDDKSLTGFKKVGKYWGKMIDESINEKSGRKAINAKINKIIGIKADKKEKKNEEKSEEEKTELIVEMGPKDLINKKKESEEALISMSEFYATIFSKKCVVKELDSNFYPYRCGAFDSTIGTIACSALTNLVHFYSARTGARHGFMVFGLESTVTCLNLHENKTQVFIGCQDGTLISKDIRTNKTTLVYNGHSKAVLSIFTTASKVLSSSLDNTIKYFCLWSGVCLLCVDLQPNFNISSMLVRSDKPSWVAIGSAEGVLVLVDVEAKKFLCKIKLHSDEITQLTNDENFLITGSKSGKIRIWDMNRLEANSVILRPYYNIDAESSVLSLKFFKNQIYCGCENGTVKIISLVTGKVLRTLKISPQTPITGVDITEDKLFVKLIIWHEKGIEIRTFSLQKSSSKKISKEKDNQESKQKAPKETKKNKTSEMGLRDSAEASQETIGGKRTIFAGMRKPVHERCCTLPTIRTKLDKSRELKKSVFTEAYNLSHFDPNDLWLYSFPRVGNMKI